MLDNFSKILTQLDVTQLVKSGRKGGGGYDWLECARQTRTVIFECCKNDTEVGVVVDRKTRPILFKCVVRPSSIDEALIYAHGRPYRGGRRVGSPLPHHYLNTSLGRRERKRAAAPCCQFRQPLKSPLLPS